RTPALIVYVGTYTGEKSKGIYVSRLDLASGTLSPATLAAETPSPSYLAVHPTGRFLFAANEANQVEGKPSGSVSAVRVDASSGGLTAINAVASQGAGPAHLIVDHRGRHVLVANYGGGSAAVLPIAADGALQPASGFVQHSGSSVNKD